MVKMLLVFSLSQPTSVDGGAGGGLAVAGETILNDKPNCHKTPSQFAGAVGRGLNSDSLSLLSVSVIPPWVQMLCEDFWSLYAGVRPSPPQMPLQSLQRYHRRGTSHCVPCSSWKSVNFTVSCGGQGPSCHTALCHWGTEQMFINDPNVNTLR